MPISWLVAIDDRTWPRQRRRPGARPGDRHQPVPVQSPPQHRFDGRPKSYVLGLTQRPFTTFDQKWELVCMLCTELPTLENGKAVAEDAPGGKQGVALTYRIRPDAAWGDGTPITTKDVLFTWEVGRHPKSGVGNAELYRRIWQIDVVDDKTFILHDEKLGFNYNAINDFRLLPEHLERPVFEADPETYRNRTLFDTDPTNPGLAFGPYRIAQLDAGQPDRARAQPDLVGRAAGVRPDRGQGHREHDRARGQPALRRDRHDRGLGSACRSIRLWPSSAATATASRSSTSRGWSYEHIDVMLDNPVLADVRVRQALLYGLDRAAISEQLFAGRSPWPTRPCIPWTGSTPTTCEHYPFDPAKAASLLDQPAGRRARRAPTRCRRASRCDSS